MAYAKAERLRRYGQTLILFVGAIWAVFQYHTHVEEGRVAAVLGFQHELRADPLYKAWRNVTISNLDNLRAQANARKSGSKSWNAYSISLALKAKDDLESMLSFYDSLSVCIDRSICDRDTAIQLFGRESSIVYTYYGAYISCNRTKFKDEGYAAGIISIRRYFVLKTLNREPHYPAIDVSECGLVNG
jgi:hypothetical protein